MDNEPERELSEPGDYEVAITAGQKTWTWRGYADHSDDALNLALLNLETGRAPGRSV